MFPEGVELVGGRCGGKMLVTRGYGEERREEVFRVLSLVTEPALVRKHTNTNTDARVIECTSAVSSFISSLSLTLVSLARFHSFPPVRVSSTTSSVK